MWKYYFLAIIASYLYLHIGMIILTLPPILTILKSVFFWLTFYHTVRVITYCPSKCFSCIILLPFSTSTRRSSSIEVNPVNPVKILTSSKPTRQPLYMGHFVYAYGAFNVPKSGISCTPMGQFMYLYQFSRVSISVRKLHYIQKAINQYPKNNLSISPHSPSPIL